MNQSRKDGGLGEMKIPLYSDLSRQAAIDYGVLHEDGCPLRYGNRRLTFFPCIQSA